MTSGRPEPRWLDRLVVEAIHTDTLATHGGLAGPAVNDLLEGALARPCQRWSYDRSADIPVLAAAYAYGLARSHAYPDGNKRVAFVAMAVFLGLNGLDLVAQESEVVTTVIALAEGSLEESQLAEWIRGHVRQRPSGSP